MEQHTLKVLEYRKIISELKGYAASKRGKDYIKGLEPGYDLKEVEERLKEVTEAKIMLGESPNVPFGGIRDLRPMLKRATKGITLNGKELLDVTSTLFAARRLKDFFNEKDEEMRQHNNPYTRLFNKARQIVTFKHIEEEINKAIDNAGEVVDNASPKLRSIRNNMRTISGRIKDKLNSIITGSTYQRMIQDAIVTVRNDRYVVPIKSEYKGSFDGIVHDRSSSGQTLFIEPMVVVKLNNELRQLSNDEEAEVQRILKELTRKVTLEVDRILDTLEVLGELDFIFAKARYSQKVNGSEPTLNDLGIINLKQARHPLLKDEAVPIDVRVGDGFNTLVITGPNTGGKTVTLKTVGLLTLMMQSGLHIPASPGSDMSIFNGIYADIGDEQSIEQSLSTFSSHMTQIINLLENADSKDLVLMDELGAGTDPQEGASLAMAILDFLHEGNIRTIATTHYSELKSYAYSKEGVENASMEFDLETLSPTYRLIMGLPGRSNALEIASRLGLPQNIINKARQGISTDEALVDEMIRDIKEKKQLSKKEHRKSVELKSEAEKMRRKYQEKLKKLEKKQEQVIQEAVQEAKRIVASTKQKSDNMLKKAREVERGYADRTNMEIREELKDTEKELTEKVRHLSNKPKPKTHKVPDQLEPGDKVRIISLDQKGEVLEILGDKEVVVQAGIMKVTVEKKDLEQMEVTNEHEQKKKIKKIARKKARTISSTLDLRGMRYEEARRKTDKYLDDAYLAGLGKVEIIHGKGTGALRKGIHDLLDGHHHIEEYRLGKESEGGMGVTIAKLKK